MLGSSFFKMFRIIDNLELTLTSLVFSMWLDTARDRVEIEFFANSFQDGLHHFLWGTLPVLFFCLFICIARLNVDAQGCSSYDFPVTTKSYLFYLWRKEQGISISKHSSKFNPPFQALAEIRPYLAGTGGGVLELVQINDYVVKVRLSGPAAGVMTVRVALTQKLRETIPAIAAVQLIDW